MEITEMMTTPLLEEIKKAKEQFFVDSYTLSVGEIISLYKDGELDITTYTHHYENNWLNGHKRDCIESLFLSLPIRPLVVNLVDSKWEVVCGTSVISTILEFVGILGKEERHYPCNKMSGTKFLPSLHDKAWEDLENIERVLFKNSYYLT
jgi:hypothetical protein